MNNLARLGNLKADIAGIGASSLVLDDALSRLCDQVSREFEGAAGRRFSAYRAERYVHRHPRACGTELWLPEDLASVISVQVDDDGDDVYELTLTPDTDYFSWPYDAAQKGEPIYRLDVNPNSSNLSSWPTARRSVKVTGLWGYSYELQDTTLTASAIGTTSATAVTVSAAADLLVFQGDTIVVDSEQMEVVAVMATALTVTRGINGTVAATHANGAPVYVRRYPREVEARVAERVVGLRWDAQGGYSGGVTLTGDQLGAAGRTEVRGSYARWRQTIERFHRWEVA